MNYALIFAGGIGQRMNSKSLPKQFLIVHGKPIIAHTIEKFNSCEAIDKIIVVCIKEYIEHLKEIIKQFNLNKVSNIVPGGKIGQESIYNGLDCINNHYKINDNDIVLIHDGVRPIIDNETIINNINSVKTFGNAITVTKSIETILLIDNESNVRNVEDRNLCYLGRAPQSFFLKDIYKCHLKAIKENLTNFIDSATLMRHYGYKLYTVIGPENNIKITKPIDFYIFKALLDAKEDEQITLL